MIATIVTKNEIEEAKQTDTLKVQVEQRNKCVYLIRL